jgi:hypothetical protein
MVMYLLVLIRILFVCRSNQTIRRLTNAMMAIKGPLWAGVRADDNDPSTGTYQRAGLLRAF